MRSLVRIVIGFAIALTALGAHAQQRVFNQAELDSLLAPIALYPDPLLNDVLAASRSPQDVLDAAAWAKANPQLRGDAALQTVENEPWAPSVKALVASPEVLIRMAESPKWLYDLGEAYSVYGDQILATVQQLRVRAQASGSLQSNDQQNVYQQGDAIAVQPVYPHLVYVPYYDPWTVYGPWWWPGFAPVVFRPWVPRPVFVTRIVVGAPRFAAPPGRFIPGRFTPARVVAGGTRPVFRGAAPAATVTPFRPVPESRRQPIVSSPSGFNHNGFNVSRAVPPLPPPRTFTPSRTSTPPVHAAPPARFATTRSFSPAANHSAAFGGGHGGSSGSGHSSGRGGHR